MRVSGPLLAQFTVGTPERPDVPDVVADSLTTTVDGLWVIWATKFAVAVGDQFRPLATRTLYPRDAVAACWRGGRHEAPEVRCTCGFHAVSAGAEHLIRLPRIADQLDVILCGQILAFALERTGVLFRAARQIVVRTRQSEENDPLDPDLRHWRTSPPDVSGDRSRLGRRKPRGSGPIRLQLPGATPSLVRVADDPGFCEHESGGLRDRPERRLVEV